ncbi:peptidoglycan/LPS O-acetylase OafA/YrhL [Paraburkholderia sp. GAS199]|uniref:acyltransferase family protein n=1 Tax=Paraburkholderia sp. GAS199 TaxID=3035126 RepID=UPI003D228F65
MSPGAFRFFLATVVLVFHYSSFGVGHTPVYLFFALSGYWVYSMWTHKYESTRDPYVTFMISRIWRLAPVFLLCSFIALAITMILPLIVTPQVPFATIDARAWVSSLLILGYNTASGVPLTPAWSLDIELQFYFVAPLVIVLLQKRPALAVGVCLAVSAASITLFYDRAFMSYLPWFVAGILTAKYPALKPAKPLALGSGAVTLLTIAVFAAVPALRPVLFGGAHHSALYADYNPLLNIGLAVLALPFAFATVSVRSSRFDRFLSDASYSLYLVHWLPLLFLSHYATQLGGLPAPTRVLVTVPVVALSFVLSAAITQYVDRPCSRVRERFVKQRRTAERPAPVGVTY